MKTFFFFLIKPSYLVWPTCRHKKGSLADMTDIARSNCGATYIQIYIYFLKNIFKNLFENMYTYSRHKENIICVTPHFLASLNLNLLKMVELFLNTGNQHELDTVLMFFFFSPFLYCAHLFIFFFFFFVIDPFMSSFHLSHSEFRIYIRIKAKRWFLKILKEIVTSYST